MERKKEKQEVHGKIGTEHPGYLGISYKTLIDEKHIINKHSSGGSYLYPKGRLIADPGKRTTRRYLFRSDFLGLAKNCLKLLNIKRYDAIND